MKRVFSIVLLLVGLLLAVDGSMQACTSFIVSGKATPDGRPLLFKNRDTGELNNLTVLVHGAKYDYVANINYPGKGESVWYGHNSAGFAIINTAAYNLNGKEGPSDANKDGVYMRMALEQCASLKDFENMLDTIRKPMDCDSNYGVIDAQGGCAYYETGAKGYVKFDVNDPKIAPLGYIVRTNFGYTGERSMDKGISRYSAISDICLRLAQTHGFTIENVLQIPRYLIHGLTHINLYNYEPSDDSRDVMMPFKDFIPRFQTASTVCIQGVKSGESPLLTVSWTIMGSPLASVVVPVCITPSHKLPGLITAGDDGQSQLCLWALSLKKELFPVSNGEGPDYINLAKLINKENTGILQKIKPIEKETVACGMQAVNAARQKGRFDSSMDDYYQWFDEFVAKSYSQQFPEILK